MPVTFNEKFIAYLALISGLLISGVAEYYSIVGFTAIFAAAVIPVIIMGIALGIGKISATIWLKQNWNIAPWTVRIYLLVAIFVLMCVTSLGIFGFLSKAHSDQSLVSGDVQSKIAIYDEKIKTARENIEANRRQLKQMDEAVDQVMARSTDEKGADKANAIRRSQQRDRVALAKDIEANQKLIASLNDEAAPIRAEVRKVEAEVGPIKYIASFIYGEADKTLLEKAVTWVIIILIVVFDPLAVILLLSSQISFQNFRERTAEDKKKDFYFGPTEYIPDPEEEAFYSKPDAWVADVGEKPTAEELKETMEGDSPEKESDVVSTATVTEPAPHHPDTHPYLRQGFVYPEGWMFGSPLVAPVEEKQETNNPQEYLVDKTLIDALEGSVNRLQDENESLKKEVELLKSQKLYRDVKTYGYSSDAGIIKVANDTYTKEDFDRLMSTEYVQNEEQQQSGLWNKMSNNTRISEEEYLEQSRKNKDDNTNNSA